MNISHGEMEETSRTIKELSQFDKRSFSRSLTILMLIIRIQLAIGLSKAVIS